MKKPIALLLCTWVVSLLAQNYSFVKEYSIYNQKTPYPKGTFRNLSEVCTDPQGNILITDFENSTVQKFDFNGNYLFGLEYDQFFIPQDPYPTGFMNKPKGIATDQDGNIYFLDYYERAIKLTRNGRYIRKWSGSTNNKFKSPNQIKIDNDNNVYVADQNYIVQKFDSAGNFILKFGQRGFDPGQFDSFSGMSIDGNNNIYISDSINSRIQKFTSNGIYVKSWNLKCGQIQYFRNDTLIVNIKDSLFAYDLQSLSLTKKIGLDIGDPKPVSFCYDSLNHNFVTIHNSSIHFKRFNENWELGYVRDDNTAYSNTFSVISNFKVTKDSLLLLYGVPTKLEESKTKIFDLNFNFLTEANDIISGTSVVVATDDSNNIYSMPVLYRSGRLTIWEFMKSNINGDTVYKLPEHFSEYYSAVVDSNGFSYVIGRFLNNSTRVTINKISPQGQVVRSRWEYIFDDPDLNSLPIKIFIDNKQNFYLILQQGGVVKYDQNIDKVYKINEYSNTLSIDTFGNLYLANDNIIKVYNSVTGQYLAEFETGFVTISKMQVVDDFLYVMGTGKYFPNQSYIKVYRISDAISVAVSDRILSNDVVQLSPNPSESAFSIATNQTSTVEVYDAQGKKVDTFVCNGNITFGKSYKPGLYIINTHNASGENTQKVLRK
jgi:sugar lactone lactonase YvrE